MRNIVEIAHVIYDDVCSGKFEEALMEKIKNFQARGLEVEITYRQDDHKISALLIATK